MSLSLIAARQTISVLPSWKVREPGTLGRVKDLVAFPWLPEYNSTGFTTSCRHFSPTMRLSVAPSRASRSPEDFVISAPSDHFSKYRISSKSVQWYFAWVTIPLFQVADLDSSTRSGRAPTHTYPYGRDSPRLTISSNQLRDGAQPHMNHAIPLEAALNHCHSNLAYPRLRSGIGNQRTS